MSLKGRAAVALFVLAKPKFWDPAGFTADGSVEDFKRRRQTELKHGRISPAPESHHVSHMPEVNMRGGEVRQCVTSLVEVGKNFAFYSLSLFSFMLSFTMAFCQKICSFTWLPTAIFALYVPWLCRLRRQPCHKVLMKCKFVGNRRFSVHRAHKRKSNSRANHVWHWSGKGLLIFGLFCFVSVSYCWSPSNIDRNRAQHSLTGNGAPNKGQGKSGKGGAKGRFLKGKGKSLEQ